MSAEREIFERNLATLLRRAYVPQRPSAELRARVHALAEQRCAEFGARVRLARRPVTLRSRWALAAGLLAVLAAGAWLARERWGAGAQPGSASEPLARTEPPQHTVPRDGVHAPERELTPDARRARPDEGGEDAFAEQREPLEQPVPETGPQPAPEAVASGASTEDGAPAPVELRGSVRAAASGAPIEAFELVLLREVELPRVSEPDSHALTAPGGEFALPDVQPGTYRIFARAEGVATLRLGPLQVPLPAAADGSAGRLALELPAGGQLRGRLVRAEDGEPIAGALVFSEVDCPEQVIAVRPSELDVRSARAVTSAADGSFELRALGPGPQRVRALADGRAPALSPVVELADGARLELEPLALGAGAAIEGRVYDESGRPQAGAFVLASQMSVATELERMAFDYAFTDEHGRYEIRHLPPGEWILLLADRPELLQEGGLRAMRPVSLTAAGSSQVDFGTERLSALSGRVYGADGQPLGPIALMVQPAGAIGARDWISAGVDEEGRYALPAVRPGRYLVYVGKRLGPNFTKVDELVMPASGGLVHDLHLSELHVSGRVLAADAAATDAPPRSVIVLERRLADGRVEFAGRDMATGNGSFRFDFLAPGDYRASAYPLGGELAAERSAWTELRLAGEAPQLDFALVRGGEILVRVLAADGSPLVGARVHLLAPDGELMEFTEDSLTDARGELRASAQAGAWEAWIEHAGRTSERRGGQLVVGQTLELQWRWPSAEPEPR